MIKPIENDAARGHCLTMTLDHPTAWAIPLRAMKNPEWRCIRSKNGMHEIQADPDTGLVRCYYGNVLQDEYIDDVLATRVWDRWLELT